VYTQLSGQVHGGLLQLKKDVQLSSVVGGCTSLFPRHDSSTPVTSPVYASSVKSPGSVAAYSALQPPGDSASAVSSQTHNCGRQRISPDQQPPARLARAQQPNALSPAAPTLADALQTARRITQEGDRWCVQ
jgi:hypothetical protein